MIGGEITSVMSSLSLCADCDVNKNIDFEGCKKVKLLNAMI